MQRMRRGKSDLVSQRQRESLKIMNFRLKMKTDKVNKRTTRAVAVGCLPALAIFGLPPSHPREGANFIATPIEYSNPIRPLHLFECWVDPVQQSPPQRGPAGVLICARGFTTQECGSGGNRGFTKPLLL